MTQKIDTSPARLKQAAKCLDTLVEHSTWVGELLLAIAAEKEAQAKQGPNGTSPYNPTEAMRWAAKQIDPVLTHEQIRAIWCAMWSAAPQPSEPAPPMSMFASKQEYESAVDVPLPYHPEPHAHRWTELELAAIKQHREAYAQAALAAQNHTDQPRAMVKHKPVMLTDEEIDSLVIEFTNRLGFSRALESAVLRKNKLGG